MGEYAIEKRESERASQRVRASNKYWSLLEDVRGREERLLNEAREKA